MTRYVRVIQFRQDFFVYIVNLSQQMEESIVYKKKEIYLFGRS